MSRAQMVFNPGSRAMMPVRSKTELEPRVSAAVACGAWEAIQANFARPVEN